MLYMPKIADYLKILTDKEEKLFAFTNYSDCFNSVRGKLYYKISEEKNIRRVAELFYTFLTTLDEVEKHFELIKKMFASKNYDAFNFSNNCM